MRPRPTAIALAMTGVLTTMIAAQAPVAQNETAAEQPVAAELQRRQPGLSVPEALRIARGFRPSGRNGNSARSRPRWCR